MIVKLQKPLKIQIRVSVSCSAHVDRLTALMNFQVFDQELDFGRSRPGTILRLSDQLRHRRGTKPDGKPCSRSTALRPGFKLNSRCVASLEVVAMWRERVLVGDIKVKTHVGPVL